MPDMYVYNIYFYAGNKNTYLYGGTAGGSVMESAVKVCSLASHGCEPAGGSVMESAVKIWLTVGPQEALSWSRR